MPKPFSVNVIHLPFGETRLQKHKNDGLDGHYLLSNAQLLLIPARHIPARHIPAFLLALLASYPGAQVTHVPCCDTLV